MSAPPEIVRSYEDKGFLVFEDGTSLVNALGALVNFGRSFATAKRAKTTVDDACRIEARGDRLSEHQAKSILSKAGISFPREALARPNDDAGAIAETIGFPVVLKVCSPDIAHKTEIGGVVVGVKSQQDARQAAASILGNAHEHHPDARLDGVLISPMITGGVETIMGVMRDPTFGPVVMFGLGGIFVEVLKDVTFRVAPFDLDEAHRMIREIRGYALLEGVRGASPSDIGALAKMLSDLSRFAAANADVIDSIDLNPVLAMPKGRGALALDALLVFRDDAGSASERQGGGKTHG